MTTNTHLTADQAIEMANIFSWFRNTQGEIKQDILDIMKDQTDANNAIFWAIVEAKRAEFWAAQ